MNVSAVILAGGAGERLSVLSDHRAKPAVPFGGKYRIIDFALSNAVNSGIENVTVLTQYSPRSLISHIGSGRAYGLDSARHGGIKVLQPFLSRTDTVGWYAGTADAVRRNLSAIVDASTELVVVLAGDHIYKMDYRPFIETHLANAADMTVAVIEVPISEARRMGVCAVDAAGRVVDWAEKPDEPRGTLASLGIYVFDPAVLAEELVPERHDFGKDIIPAMLAHGRRVFAHPFLGYWRDVGTLDAYWSANLDLVGLVPPIDLFDVSWRIHTRSEERSPAKMGPHARATHSLVSHGCIINGTVHNSVLSPGVHLGDGATIRDSVVMVDASIAAGALVDTAIIDKGVRVGAGAVVGDGPYDAPPNIEEPGHLTTGITVVGKGAAIPPGIRIGRNVRIDAYANEADFPAGHVPSGATIHRRSDEVLPDDFLAEPAD